MRYNKCHIGKKLLFRKRENMEETQIKPNKKLEYKWVVAAVSFLMVFTVLGFCSSAKSLYISPVTEALGISRGAFSINDSCRYISTAIVNLFFGLLIAKFGARKLIGAGFICLIISCLLYSVGTNVFVFYLGGVFLGVGLSWTTTTIVGSVIGKWFREKKGTIMGAILAANGLGAMLAIQVMTPIIHDSTTKYGYQNAYRLTALILLAVGILVVSFFRNEPKDAAQEIAKNKGDVPATKELTGLPFAEILKRPYFYAAMFCIFVSGMVLQGVYGIATPLLTDVGLDEGFAATVLSVSSLSLTFSKFGVGFFYDKRGLRTTVTICFSASILAMIALSLVTNSAMGKFLALFYAPVCAIALPLETIMLPIFAGDLFGERAYNKALGIIVSVNTAGYAVGAPVANLCFDIFGTYNPALYISCVLMVVAAAIMHLAITASKKEIASK